MSVKSPVTSVNNHFDFIKTTDQKQNYKKKKKRNVILLKNKERGKSFAHISMYAY